MRPSPAPSIEACRRATRRTSHRIGLEQVILALAVTALAGCGNGIAPTVATQTAPPSVPTASALGPQLGYIWMTPTKSLLPILGIAGASQVGQSVVPAGTYINAAASATASIAVLQAADGSFDLMTLPSGSPISLGLTLPAGAQIRLSSTAAAALIFTPGASSASLITGLPSTPKVQSVAAPSAIADATVSDSGAVAVASAHSIAVTALGGSSLTVATIGAPGGMSFIPGTAHDDLLVADSANNSLTVIRSTTSGPSPQSISATGLLQSPSAVGVSGSGRWAVVANSGSQTAVRVDLSSLATTAVACSCQPTLAEPLADDGAFRVTSLASGPNWLVKAASATPNTLFIPAVPTALNTNQANTTLAASTVRP